MISEHFIVSIQGQMETSSISQHVLMCSTTKAAAHQILSLSPAPGLKGIGGWTGGEDTDNSSKERAGEEGACLRGRLALFLARGFIRRPFISGAGLPRAPLPHSSGLTPAGAMLRKEGGLVEFPTHVHGCRQVINCQPGARVWLSA